MAIKVYTMRRKRPQEEEISKRSWKETNNLDDLYAESVTHLASKAMQWNLARLGAKSVFEFDQRLS